MSRPAVCELLGSGARAGAHGFAKLAVREAAAAGGEPVVVVPIVGVGWEASSRMCSTCQSIGCSGSSATRAQGAAGRSA